ncbi:MAG: LptF/LptG family permease [Epsilonproteobacteria bacterium]|nr:LptF/LptG family permease [Campylobacterota bacterium]
MNRLSRYLINNFFNGFFTLFSILFVIASMVLLITISNMTAILKVNFQEFVYLYVLTLPEIIFYTIPLSFFITATLSIARLFENSELIMLLSAGVAPKQIVRPFFFISILMTVLLLVITFFSIPTSEILYKNFINAKKIESDFNFVPSSMGQKFGNWNVFIKDKHKNKYKDIVLYNDRKHILILANKATTIRNDNYFTLALDNGRLYHKNHNKISIISFKHFNLNQKISITPITLTSIKEYITKYKTKVNKYLIISVFPMIMFFFIPSISFFHNRYQKNHAVAYSLVLSVLYYAMAFVSYKNLYAILIITPIFLTLAVLSLKRIKRF